MLYALISAIVLGALSTAGDYVWAAFQLRHRTVFGLVHGAAICLAIGAAIGVREHRAVPAILVGPLIGVLAAACFYLLAPGLGWGAMFPAWMLFWICFALVQAWLAREARPAPVLVRGAAAAILSGLAFYSISGIWTRPSPGGPDYARHFLSWTFAFLPGFVALFWRRSIPADPR